jgi:hypothetical protein
VCDHLQSVVLALRVHLVAEGGRRGVDDPDHFGRLAVAPSDHPAALVRQVLARVRNHLVDKALGDAHLQGETGVYHQTVESRFSISSIGFV